MKVLIVGGTSSLAIALKPKLLEFCEVVTAGRKNCDIKMDLQDPAGEIVFPENLDVIINTAAHFGGNSYEDIFNAEQVNVFGTLKLCQAAVRSNAKHFILISSIFVCLDPNSRYYSSYALSKSHSEEIAKLHCSLNAMPLSILRPSQIYGIGENFRNHQPFFYSMLDKAQNNEDVTIYGENDPLRNYIYVDDLATIIAKVVLKRVVGTYSCTQMTDVTYSEIAKAAYKSFGTDGVVSFLIDKPSIPDNIFAKEDALYKKINFYPQVSIEEGIKKIAFRSRQ